MRDLGNFGYLNMPPVGSNNRNNFDVDLSVIHDYLIIYNNPEFINRLSLLDKGHSISYNNIMVTEQRTHFHTSPNCPFCNIISGKTPGIILKENKDVLMLLSLEGHPLVIPRLHYSPDTLPDNIAAELGRLTYQQKTIEAIKKTYQATDLNILLNHGKLAGSEEEHTHIHIIPRRNNQRPFYINLSTHTTEDRLKFGQSLKNLLNQD